MKKTISLVFSLIILLVLAFYIFLYPKLEIVSGFNAKILCSCHFNTGLDQERIEAEDLGFSLLWLASNDIFEEEKKVETSVLGMQRKTAVYREGLGCTLVNTLNPEKIKNQFMSMNDIDYTKEIWDSEMVVPSPYLQKAMATAFDSTAEKKLLTRAVIIVKDGKLIGEAYAPGINKDSKLLGWSMTKSVTSILAGILARDSILDISIPLDMEQWKNDNRKKISWHHALNMTPGLRWDEDYSKVSTATRMLYGSDDMGMTAAENELEFEPGTHWEYSSGTTNIIARRFSMFFNSMEEYHRFPYERLFGPIGARSFLIETDASGYFVGSSYGYATGRDWAKVGLLMLNQGNWDGNQIIDTTWVDFCTDLVPSSQGKYGGQFWLNKGNTYKNYSENSYWMSGYQGQQVAIHPDENLVIVRLGITNTRGDFDFDRFTKNVLEAVKKSEPYIN